MNVFTNESRAEALRQAREMPLSALNGRDGAFAPLLLAVLGGWRDVASVLISRGVDLDVEIQGLDGVTALSLVVCNGWKAECAQMLARGCRRGIDYALHVVGASREIAEMLIEAGANPRARMPDGDTPLHRVTAPEVVQLLVGLGADVNAVNESGSTPLMRVAVVHWPLRSALGTVIALYTVFSLLISATPTRHVEAVQNLARAAAKLQSP